MHTSISSILPWSVISLSLSCLVLVSLAQDDTATEDTSNVFDEATLKVGDTFSDPLSSGGVGPEMVFLDSGYFDMGCVSGIGCFDNELPVRNIQVQQFAIGRNEVTFDDYAIFAKASLKSVPDDNQWGEGQNPVINVSWYDARAYTKWLSKQTGANYRLPSESEWEYAARAGTETRFNWGDSVMNKRAACDECNDSETVYRTVKVRSFAANAWEIFDVHGNVAEWTQDCWNNSHRNANTDGTAREKGDCTRRVVRGGSWILTPDYVKSASRNYFNAENKVSFLGFRVVRDMRD